MNDVAVPRVVMATGGSINATRHVIFPETAQSPLSHGEKTGGCNPGIVGGPSIVVLCYPRDADTVDSWHVGCISG